MLKFLRKYTWLLFLVFLIILFPQSLTDQAKLNMRVIITGIGVDYIDDKYQITSQIVLPANGTESGGISAHISYITASADTISDGIQRVSYKLGKFAELSHIEFILVGETMKDHNLASSLDYFFRNFKLKNSIMLLACKGEAKETIQKTSDLELGVALSLQKIYLSNENSLNGVETSYVDFISETNSISGCSVLDSLVISTAKENSSSSGSSSGQSSSSSTSESSGGSSSGSQESSSSSSSNSSSSQQSAKILTKRPLILFKNGNFVGKITDENQVLGYYFANNKSNMGNIFLSKFNYGDIVNANLNLRIDQMRKSNKISFVNNKPVHTININIKELRIDEIAPQNNTNPNLYKHLSLDVQDAILQEARKQIKQNINSVFVASQELNFDIFKTADLCNKFNNAEWQNFINNCDNPEEYIKDVTVVVNVNFDRIT